MDEPKDKHSTHHGRKLLNPFAVHKKKRSLVERELETNMTARVTSPVTVADGESTSRYGRARRIKNKDDKQKVFIETLKSPKSENMPVKVQSPITKPAVNSSYKIETPKKALETSLDNFDNIYQDNKQGCFINKKVLTRSPSSGKKIQKVYIRQDLIQNRDDDDDNILLIKDLFSPKSGKKKNKVIESLSAKKNSISIKQNGHIENASVVKALDFDDNKKMSNSNKRDSDGNKKDSNCNKRDSNGNKKTKENVSKLIFKNDLYPVEDASLYEVGDLAWARMGTFPFWPCIITKDPESAMFVRKKLFGRIEHDILHVTFFGDNGRRSWVVDNMLRKYMGLEEFLYTREKFTAEDKKRDPRLYSAFFISEKKLSFWNASIEEAEMINREPKSRRIDVFNDLLYRTRESKKLYKSGKVTRTDSDVSLSESLYDSLFSEDDSKTDDTIRSRNRSRNRSLDVSDVVTACLDNMAAKTGNIKIQKQSHMDRWLQKAKSKTPEKVKTTEQVTTKTPVVIPKTEIVTPRKDTTQDKIDTPNIEKVTLKVEKPVSNNKKKKLSSKEVKITKVYSLRRSYEPQNILNELTEIKKIDSNDEPKMECNEEMTNDDLKLQVELLNNDNKETSTANVNDLSPKPTNKDTAIESEVDKLTLIQNQDIKSEIMDVEESSENIVNSVVIAEEILDSPIKTEKESTMNDNLSSSVILDCDSPVKTEIDSSIKTKSPTNKDLQAKQDTIEVDIRINSTLNESDQFPPTLKGNEMVSIPENALMTDDECDSVTSIENNTDEVNLQDHNSNLTSMSVKANNDIVVSTSKNNEKHNIVVDDFDNKKVSEKQEDSIYGNKTEDVTMNEEDLLAESGASESILQKDDSADAVNDKLEVVKESGSSNYIEKTESILEISKSDALEPNITKETSDVNTVLLGSPESESFLGDSLNIDVYKDTRTATDCFFLKINMDKPPDLTLESIADKADLLQNIKNNDSKSECDEDSEDEPSPEYEPLGDDITEDFRQHMKCIESSVTDKKDDAQLVKICNEIAIIEESKAKLFDIKTSLNKIIPNTSMLCSSSSPTLDEAQKLIKEEKIKAENDNLSHVENIPRSIKSNETNDLTKEIKAEILDGVNIMKKSIENSLKSPPDNKKHRLSLKREKSEHEDVKQSIILNDTTVNLRYKTIDQIEEIIKSKPKRLPIENGEVSIPEINDNGFHTKREVDTSDHLTTDDDDFDIDEASVNSEDSEVSQEKLPSRRSLRSRPAKKSGLQDPEFLTYMELRQDDLIEEHPELSMDDIVLYLYKTYTYSKNFESESEELPTLKTIKQETPPSRKKSKKNSQPKNTIENFFRVKYNNAKKIDFDSISGTFDSIEDMKPKRGIRSISPSDSGIGNSKDSNVSDVSVAKRKSITKDIKVELINDVANNKEASSPKTSKRLRKKTTSPKASQSLDSKSSPEGLVQSLDNRVAIVMISPMKDKHIEAQHYKNITGTTGEPDIELKQEDTEIKHEPDTITKHETVVILEPETIMRLAPNTSAKHMPETETKHELDTKAYHEPDINLKRERDIEIESLDSDSELPLRQLRSKVQQENKLNEFKNEILQLKDEIEDTASINSDEPLLGLKPRKIDKSIEGSYEDPEFLKYLELKQDAIIEENSELSQNEIKAYLYKTWIYEKNSKSDLQKSDDIVSSNLVKGLNQEPPPPRKARRKPKAEKNTDTGEVIAKDKPKRKTVTHYYNEAFLSDIEDELEVFEIFKTKKTSTTIVPKLDSPKKEAVTTKTEDTIKNEIEDICDEINSLDEIELYFKQLTSPKPSVFKGLIREKVCGICEDVTDLIKCTSCHGTFHYDCVKKVVEIVETPTTFKGRKKKKKVSRKAKNLEDSDHSDEREVSLDDISIEEVPESITIDADILESQLEARMKELLENDTQLNYDSYSSDDGIDWTDTIPGKCELVDVKLKRSKPPIDYANFKCNNCQKYDTPVCFVCKSATSKTGVKIRQKCNSAHCYSYYHLECLDHWPQTQFNAGEWTRNHKKSNEHFEAFTCPRHVCHTCVSDDPRGCKTRFSGDKLAKCVRCPATYHSFNKCLPAGTQILTASFIICPRHYEHRPGKVPCHVNTGWCFICALGGSLICCEYCPTSFHAECLNIKPPEGNYMCEDCETGRLPLYEEMVWVKLGHYRWWPGVILHPSEIPDNIMAVKHGLGEFVVRFFGQYDHYWVNRGRVFPYQEGDSGRISSQKSKIDVAFTTAMEHAQRAFEILKNAEPDEEESLDIASSLLPPHYVKLKCNKPIGSLLGRKAEDPSLSLTQCECDPADTEPCGPNSQCINRMLLTECGPTCRAGDRCNNRAFEKRLYPKLTPYKALHRGWGLKTLVDIKAGQFVIEYVGELLDEEEFQRRMSRKHEIRDENFYFLTLDKERMIDAGPKGNLARFMNHCCEPNCETQKWTVLGDIRVGLFAIDDIKANSEVTFNYNLECTGIEKKRCMCGAKRCSGYIGAKPKQLDESQRKKNGSITGKRKYTKRKNIEDSPSTVKNKVKKPLGRPPKAKELTEIEKDLLIIKNAIVDSSGESSRCQSVEEKNLKPLKKKMDCNTTDEDTISSEDSQTLQEMFIRGRTESSKAIKNHEHSNTMEEVTFSNCTETSKTLKRKLDSNVSAEVAISSEPSAKRLKCDKQIEVSD